MLTKEEEQMTKDDLKRNRKNGRDIEEQRRKTQHVNCKEQERETLRI